MRPDAVGTPLALVESMPTRKRLAAMVIGFFSPTRRADASRVSREALERYRAEKDAELDELEARTNSIRERAQGKGSGCASPSVR